MLKLASSLATLLLLLAYGAPARAADCLQQIDGLIVEYDLPASEVMAGTQTTGAAGAQAGTPARRAGTAAPRQPLAPTTRGGSVDFPKLPPHNHLTADQRERLEAKLHQARETEALGKEDQCLGLVKEAQAIVAKHR